MSLVPDITAGTGTEFEETLVSSGSGGLSQSEGQEEYCGNPRPNRTRPLSDKPVYHSRSRWQPSLASVGRRLATRRVITATPVAGNSASWQTGQADCFRVSCKPSHWRRMLKIGLRLLSKVRPAGALLSGRLELSSRLVCWIQFNQPQGMHRVTRERSANLLRSPARPQNNTR